MKSYNESFLIFTLAFLIGSGIQFYWHDLQTIFWVIIYAVLYLTSANLSENQRKISVAQLRLDATNEVK